MRLGSRDFPLAYGHLNGLYVTLFKDGYLNGLPVPGFKVNHSIIGRNRELLRCRKRLQALPDLLSLRSQSVPVHQLPVLKGSPCSSTSRCRTS